MIHYYKFLWPQTTVQQLIKHIQFNPSTENSCALNINFGQLWMVPLRSFIFNSMTTCTETQFEACYWIDDMISFESTNFSYFLCNYLFHGFQLIDICMGKSSAINFLEFYKCKRSQLLEPFCQSSERSPKCI